MNTGFSRRAQLAILLAAGDDRAAAALLSNSADSLRSLLTPDQAARIAAVPGPAVEPSAPAVPPRAVPGRTVAPVQSAGIVVKGGGKKQRPAEDVDEWERMAA
jgi:hypothetical protein